MVEFYSLKQNQFREYCEMRYHGDCVQFWWYFGGILATESTFEELLSSPLKDNMKFRPYFQIKFVSSQNIYN